MLLDPGLQADVQVELILLVVACPSHFLKAIRLGVDELGVLGDGLVWVSDGDKSNREESFQYNSSPEGEIYDVLGSGRQYSTFATIKHSTCCLLSRPGHLVTPSCPFCFNAGVSTLIQSKGEGFWIKKNPPVD